MERGCIIAGVRRECDGHRGEAEVTVKNPWNCPPNAGWDGIKSPQALTHISKGGDGVCNTKRFAEVSQGSSQPAAWQQE